MAALARPGHTKIKIFRAIVFNNRHASAPGALPPACYFEIGVVACALAGRKSPLCFYLLPGQEALHVFTVVLDSRKP